VAQLEVQQVAQQVLQPEVQQAAQQVVQLEAQQAAQQEWRWIRNRRSRTRILLHGGENPDPIVPHTLSHTSPTLDWASAPCNICAH